MRVAQVTPYISGIGGMEVYVLHLSRYLRQQGESVCLAAPVPGRESTEESHTDGFRILQYPVPGAPTRAEVQGLEPVRGVERLHRWLQAERFDVVHFHGLGLGMGGSEIAVARASGARTLLTLHLPNLGLTCLRGSMMQWGRQPCDGVAERLKCAACVAQARGVPRGVAGLVMALASRNPEWGRIVPGPLGHMAALPGVVGERIRMQQAAWNNCDAVIAVAEWARQVLLLNGAPEERLMLNRGGVSLGRLQPPLKPRGYSRKRMVRIGFIGRFDPDKGAQMLVRAFRRLPAAAPAELEMCGAVGMGSWSEELSKVRRLAEGDGRIRIRTNVAREEIAATLPTWDVLCCPSRLFELGPMVVMEAHAARVPAIGSDLPNINCLIEDGVNGRLFPARSESGLARVLAEIVNSPERTVQTWRKALKPARTMDEVSADYLALYRRLLTRTDEQAPSQGAAGGA